MNDYLSNDIKCFKEIFPLADNLNGSSFLITGGTGLIGSILVKCLLNLQKQIAITVPVRSREKALKILGDENQYLCIVECDLNDYLEQLNDKFDYIVHLASPTSGQYITRYPSETYELTIETTRSLLHYAKNQNVKGMVYVSSIEYYGQNSDDKIITEDFLGYLDMSSTRSAYPMGKRAAEYLCFSFAKEYGVPVKIARLTQTFGVGVSKEDNRVFAQFARSIINKDNIVMHTKGESAKPYCYTIDCVSALLFILMKGKIGEPYNVANQSTYISIRELAEFLRDNFCPIVKVIVEEHPELGYAPVTKLHLSTDKLMKLGWKPQVNLKDMFNRLINSMQ